MTVSNKIDTKIREKKTKDKKSKEKPKEEKSGKLTEMVFILDRSGSMGGLESDTIGGFNSMIEKQKKEEGKAIVSTILFSNDIQILHDRVDLKDVKKMTDKEYYVTSTTALMDAVGSTIERIKNVQKKSKTVPDSTLFVIVTDGLENASREYNRKMVKALIDAQKEKGWDFLFLGANIDVAEEAEMIGIYRHNAMAYECNEVGIKNMYRVMSCRVACARKTGNFKDKD